MSVTFGNCSILPCLLIFFWQFVGISDKSIPTAFLHENQHEAFLLKCQSAHCSWAFIILNGKQINYFVYLLFYLNWNNEQYVICFNGLNKTFKLFLNMSNTGNVGWGFFFVCFGFCFVPHPLHFIQENNKLPYIVILSDMCCGDFKLKLHIFTYFWLPWIFFEVQDNRMLFDGSSDKP